PAAAGRGGPNPPPPEPPARPIPNQPPAPPPKAPAAAAPAAGAHADPAPTAERQSEGGERCGARRCGDACASRCVAIHGEPKRSAGSAARSQEAEPADTVGASRSARLIRKK